MTQSIINGSQLIPHTNSPHTNSTPVHTRVDQLNPKPSRAKGNANGRELREGLSTYLVLLLLVLLLLD